MLGVTSGDVSGEGVALGGPAQVLLLPRVEEFGAAAATGYVGSRRQPTVSDQQGAGVGGSTDRLDVVIDEVSDADRRDGADSPPWGPLGGIDRPRLGCSWPLFAFRYPCPAESTER
jgi:hypothetical protein